MRVIDLGLTRYKDVWEKQRELHSLRVTGQIPDTLILTEHFPVYTLGIRGNQGNIIAKQAFLDSRQIEVVRSDRGGDVTCHVPGQVVGYPIIDLKQHKTSAAWYMRSLEKVLIMTLAQWGIEAVRDPKFTGVWVGADKIAALGVRISRLVTMHGFALNVNCDLDYFKGIIPCGIADRGVTSLKKVLGHSVNIDGVKKTIISSFKQVFP
ncbi:lipoyl(octanoyl) transferase LipB, partial [Elusimicrobiota bacterium]